MSQARHRAAQQRLAALLLGLRFAQLRSFTSSLRGLLLRLVALPAQRGDAKDQHGLHDQHGDEARGDHHRQRDQAAIKPAQQHHGAHENPGQANGLNQQDPAGFAAAKAAQPQHQYPRPDREQRGADQGDGRHLLKVTGKPGRQQQPRQQRLDPERQDLQPVPRIDAQQQPIENRHRPHGRRHAEGGPKAGQRRPFARQQLAREAEVGEMDRDMCQQVQAKPDEQRFAQRHPQHQVEQAHHRGHAEVHAQANEFAALRSAEIVWPPQGQARMQTAAGLDAQVENTWMKVRQVELEDERAVVEFAAGDGLTVAAAALCETLGDRLEQSQVV